MLQAAECLNVNNPTSQATQAQPNNVRILQ